MQVPAQDDLGGRDVVGPCGGDDRLGVEDLAPADRAPRLRRDAPLGVGGTLVRLWEGGVHLDLVARRSHAGRLDDLVEVGGREVADADRADQPRLARVDEPLPSLHVVALRGLGQWMSTLSRYPEVHDLQRGLDARAGVLVVTAGDFGLDEDIAAVDAAHPDRLGHLSLVAVVDRRVDEPVAHPRADAMARTPSSPRSG